MMLKPTVIAIPLFALLIAAEAFYANRKNSAEYADRKDTWINIFIGFTSVVWGALFGVVKIYAYVYFYEIAPDKFPADAWWA